MPARASYRLHIAPGSASASGGALARDYGSDLLPLKSPFSCSRATLFLAPPDSGGFQALPGPFPPRQTLSLSLPLCGGIFWWVCPPESVSACWLAVATPTSMQSGHCVSSAGRNFPRILTRPGNSFSLSPAANLQVRSSVRVRPRPGRFVSFAPLRHRCRRFHREPGAPTAPGLSPVVTPESSQRFLRSSTGSRRCSSEDDLFSLKELSRGSQRPVEVSIKKTPKFLFFNGL
jgi:hypothetical protein